MPFASRRQIEREAGLIMAIPKKRMLGTWGLWLGILIFSSLGCVIVPRAKLVRASETHLGASSIPNPPSMSTGRSWACWSISGTRSSSLVE